MADSSSIAEDALERGFQDAAMVSADELDHALSAPQTKLLVLSYGSAYPKPYGP